MVNRVGCRKYAGNRRAAGDDDDNEDDVSSVSATVTLCMPSLQVWTPVSHQVLMAASVSTGCDWTWPYDRQTVKTRLGGMGRRGTIRLLHLRAAVLDAASPSDTMMWEVHNSINVYNQPEYSIFLVYCCCIWADLSFLHTLQNVRFSGRVRDEDNDIT